jgi:hypothetical protein
MEASLNVLRGWNGFGEICSIGMFASPGAACGGGGGASGVRVGMRAPNPLPSAFFCVLMSEPPPPAG